MKIVDANVLLYATDKEAEHHQPSKRWIEDALIGTEPIGFAWVVLLAFLRISTNPRVYANPLPPEQAIGVIVKWLAQPAAFVVQPTDRHVHVLAGLLRIAGTGANLVTDADIAALALEHQAEVVTFDSDFDKFAGVRRSSPAPSPSASDQLPDTDIR